MFCYIITVSQSEKTSVSVNYVETIKKYLKNYLCAIIVYK